MFVELHAQTSHGNMYTLVRRQTRSPNPLRRTPTVSKSLGPRCFPACGSNQAYCQTRKTSLCDLRFTPDGVSGFISESILFHNECTSASPASCHDHVKSNLCLVVTGERTLE